MENTQTSLLPKFSVSDFVASINQTLEFTYPAVEIEGEVSSFKVNQGKFVFFDLKDESSSVGCFMTVWQLRVPIEDGMKVVVRAVPKVTQWGKFSLTVQAIRPSGEGSLKKSFDLLKAKLEKEGLFSEERKRQLPHMPRHIGVISSTQAAGYADFIKILDDRWGGIKVDVAHVQVQGEVAPDQIIRAIKYFNGLEHIPEVLVIIRGGGSADDLAVFNDELLVREIASSRIPTIVGVGHEVDETLADMAADVRAATPSNAAQIIVPDRKAVVSNNQAVVARIGQLIFSQIDATIREMHNSLHRAAERISSRYDLVYQALGELKSLLNAYNPEHVLARGYAILKGGRYVGEQIEIETKSELISAEVKNVRTK